jgi:hypothetical protein
MAPMSDEQFRNASAKLRDRLLRLTLKKLRENDKYFARPRTHPQAVGSFRACRCRCLRVCHGSGPAHKHDSCQERAR